MESNIIPLFNDHDFISSATGKISAKLIKIKLEIEGKVVCFYFNNNNQMDILVIIMGLLTS